MRGEQGHLVLCVDDEEIGLGVRRTILERAGYHVLTACDGTEGLELFAREPVEAVILDYSMPGMHGGEVATRIRGGSRPSRSCCFRLHWSSRRGHICGESVHDEG